jgi:hypothetical protein
MICGIAHEMTSLHTRTCCKCLTTQKQLPVQIGVSSFAAYGGHFSLELVGPLKQQQQQAQQQQDTSDSTTIDSDIPYYEPGNGFQYLQIAVDNYRISKVIAAGGTVLTGYGKCMIYHNI